MRRYLAFCLLLAFVAPVGRAGAALTCDGSAAARILGGSVRLSNGCVTRTWSNSGLISFVTDDRLGSETAPVADFTLLLDGASVGSDSMTISAVSVSGNGTGHASATWHLLVPGVAEITRTTDLFAGTAGFISRTQVDSLAPLTLSGYELDRVGVGPNAAATIQAFRAGSDWRDPSWNPPSIGDAHTGDVRFERSAAAGVPLTGEGEWISAALPSALHVGIVNERRDYASSVVSYSGGIESAGVDFSRDIVYIGPFEETGHVQNPGPAPARHRVIRPGRALDLEPVYTFFGAGADDEAWQFFKLIARHRAPQYRKAVIFNSDGVDRNKISTGAKDDMNYERFLQILPAVQQMGFDMFVFDDGWMARSGDWCPDSPQCPEPRAAAHPTWGPRFPDDHFGAVKAKLDEAGIALGLWMNPMEFNPSAEAFQKNPQWACAPVGHGLAVYNAAEPNSSSNEAGLGVWNPNALGVNPDTGAPQRLIDHIEERLRRMIEFYGATFFKFDFLAWVDCAGVDAVDMYEYRDAFVAMLDRVIADHPDVTYEIDDTNDYRMFPFETIARGPSWYQNGAPTFSEQMHNVWKLAPFVPGYALGQRVLARRDLGIDTMMAAAINSHMTFSQPVDENFTPEEREQVARWTTFYKENRDTLATFAYPLLEDPARKAWTAMQPWDGDTHSGWLLAYRQDSTESTQLIPLRGFGSLPGTAQLKFTRIDPATGVVTGMGVHTVGELYTSGLAVEIGNTNGYAIIRIEPV